MLFIEYPKCTTCKKAKKWLDDNGFSYTDRHIVENNPTAEEIRESGRSVSTMKKLQQKLKSRETVFLKGGENA